MMEFGPVGFFIVWAGLKEVKFGDTRKSMISQRTSWSCELSWIETRLSVRKPVTSKGSGVCGMSSSTFEKALRLSLTDFETFRQVSVTRRKQKKAELKALLDATVVTFLLSLISPSFGDAFGGAIRNQDSSSHFTNELTIMDVGHGYYQKDLMKMNISHG
ncbi:hypothetical protein OIU85_003312 [Salix viminalis]|uniref:Uncharacterized protein n=1 Tax=Salix viminalis TaxID=40686 RepID=A0A9Q0PYW2_SALVM|nr:hypothetical protein OIU85_003312 [Salix viminalis]